MTDIETNIFPILNVDDLKLRYDTYRVRNLRRDQDEYFQNRDLLARDLSYKLKVPALVSSSAAMDLIWWCPRASRTCPHHSHW